MEHFIVGLLNFVYGAETVSPLLVPLIERSCVNSPFCTVSSRLCLRDLSALTLSTLVQGPA